MSENSDSSSGSNTKQPNNTATSSPLQRWKDIFELASKAAIVTATLGGLLLANDFKDKLSAATLLNQREQAETSLRATMFNNLMDRIVNKEKADDPEKLSLLAQLLAFNFHGHFQFKPLLVELYERSLKSSSESDNAQILDAKKKNIRSDLESLARRITDQQIDMLRATVLTLTQGDGYKTPAGEEIQDLFTSDIFFKESTGSETLTISSECNYVDGDSYMYMNKDSPKLAQLIKRKEQLDKKKNNLEYEMAKLQKELVDETEKLDNNIKNSQQNPASFINAGTSQCIAVLPPGGDYKLDIAISSANFDKKTVALSVNVSGQKLRGVNMVYEFEVTPFDFPLTDNTMIDSDHRFAIVQKSMDEDSGIWLRLIWFPKGYITEQERPMNYAEMRKMLGIRKEKEEKKWYNPKTWWSNSTTPSQ